MRGIVIDHLMGVNDPRIDASPEPKKERDYVKIIVKAAILNFRHVVAMPLVYSTACAVLVPSLQ